MNDPRLERFHSDGPRVARALIRSRLAAANRFDEDTCFGHDHHERPTAEDA